MREIHIGTSGWHYKHWRNTFYPQELESGRFLEFYGEHFKTAEINNSFYRLPEKKTLATWAAVTPDDFLFAIKASRYLTHMKKLKDPEEPLQIFLDRAKDLGGKLGPILFQLPPKWRCNVERLQTFLALLPKGYRYAFEFRDPSWHTEAVYKILKAAGAAFCIFHLAGTISPKEITADFVYLRLHGPKNAYQGSYDSKTLAGWAGDFIAWRRQNKEIFCYFDNDENGYAAANALQLAQMIND